MRPARWLAASIGVAVVATMFQVELGRVASGGDVSPRAGIAAGPPARVARAKASLNGRPFQETTYPIVVPPGASVQLLVEALDVNTRLLQIDVSDFTRQRAAGARIEALLQPTMGPNPAATAGNWRAARRENWDAAKEKTLCRDDNENEDAQQVMLTFSNQGAGGAPIASKITVRSEALCAWAVNATFAQAGLLVVPVPSNWAYGTFDRDLEFKLTPVSEPVLCRTAKLPCLPLVGNQAHSLGWKLEVERVDAVEHSKTVGVAAGAGERAIRNVVNPGAGQAPPSALFQRMQWDTASRKFRPVFSMTFIDSASRRLGGSNTLRVQATYGTLRWDTVGREWCGDGIDWVYDYVNTNGLVKETETGCPDTTKTYGKTGPLVFSGLDIHEFTKAARSNPRGSGLCTVVEQYAPYNFLSGGPCLRLTAAPHTGSVEASLRFSGMVGPDRIEPPGGYPQTGSCEQTGLSCEILAHAMGYENWPMDLTVALGLKREPSKD